MSRILVGIVALAGLASSAGAQNPFYCSGRWNLAPGTMDQAGLTKRDQICQLVFRPRDKRIVGYRVVKRPAHGVIGSAGQDGDGGLYTAYKPAASYVGSDVFEVEIRYVPLGAAAGAGQEVTTRLRMNMVVE
jgi:hypothetical protein